MMDRIQFEQMMPQYRHKQLYNRKFQRVYLSAILAAVLVVMGVAIATVYFGSFLFLTDKISDIYPQGRFVSVMRQTLGLLLASFAVLIPIIIVAGMRASQIVARPLYLIERRICEIAAGDLEDLVPMKPSDIFYDISFVINALTRILKDRRLQELDFFARVGQALSNASKLLKDSRTAADQAAARLIVETQAGVIMGHLKSLQPDKKRNDRQ